MIKFWWDSKFVDMKSGQYIAWLYDPFMVDDATFGTSSMVPTGSFLGKRIFNELLKAAKVTEWRLSINGFTLGSLEIPVE